MLRSPTVGIWELSKSALAVCIRAVLWPFSFVCPEMAASGKSPSSAKRRSRSSPLKVKNSNEDVSPKSKRSSPRSDFKAPEALVDDAPAEPLVTLDDEEEEIDENLEEMPRRGRAKKKKADIVSPKGRRKSGPVEASVIAASAKRKRKASAEEEPKKAVKTMRLSAGRRQAVDTSPTKTTPKSNSTVTTKKSPKESTTVPKQTANKKAKGFPLFPFPYAPPPPPVLATVKASDFVCRYRLCSFITSSKIDFYDHLKSHVKPPSVLLCPRVDDYTCQECERLFQLRHEHDYEKPEEISALKAKKSILAAMALDLTTDFEMSDDDDDKVDFDVQACVEKTELTATEKKEIEEREKKARKEKEAKEREEKRRERERKKEEERLEKERKKEEERLEKKMEEEQKERSRIEKKKKQPKAIGKNKRRSSDVQVSDLLFESAHELRFQPSVTLDRAEAELSISCKAKPPKPVKAGPAKSLKAPTKKALSKKDPESPKAIIPKRGRRPSTPKTPSKEAKPKESPSTRRKSPAKVQSSPVSRKGRASK